MHDWHMPTQCAHDLSGVVPPAATSTLSVVIVWHDSPWASVLAWAVTGLRQLVRCAGLCMAQSPHECPTWFVSPQVASDAPDLPQHAVGLHVCMSLKDVVSCRRAVYCFDTIIMESCSAHV